MWNQVDVNILCLTRKKGDKVCVISRSHNVWMFNILNEHDGMHQFICQFCAFLTWG